MRFSFLRTSAFRNLADVEINTQGKDIFLAGENGQGKTNFLEALYFCSYASSFRGVKDGALARRGERDFSAAAGIETVPVRGQLLVKCEGGKKTITLDGKKIEDRKDLVSLAPCVVFCHEDMEFVSGPPERRRWFFDQTQGLYDPVYLDDLRRFRRVLKTRNAVLRDGGGFPDRAMLDTLDPQLAGYGLKLMEKRAAAAADFSAAFGPLYEEVAGIAGIAVRYAPSWKAASVDGALEFLAARRELDAAAGRCLSGPHRDHYFFTQGEEEFSVHASTGQRRLLALLLRSAQARRFSAQTGKMPVLLLDDVLLELDGEKRRRFLAAMPGYDQAFFTFLPEEPYERYRKSDTLVYGVKAGTITPL